MLVIHPTEGGFEQRAEVVEEVILHCGTTVSYYYSERRDNKDEGKVIKACDSLSDGNGIRYKRVYTASTIHPYSRLGDLLFAYKMRIVCLSTL